MRVINATNVDEALRSGLELLNEVGVWQQSRNGDVLVTPFPVMTVYHKPTHRVLASPKRDANPVFHLMEALWMLAGKNDARWLDQFVGDFSARYAEESGHMHGAYGFRWRKHFDMEGGGEWAGTGEPGNGVPDQLETVITLLKANPDDRRIVISMWDPVADLAVNKKDVPCNTHLYVRVRKEQQGQDYGDGGYWPSVLDLSICCRSNDAVWGAHGANAVHFSVLQEYLAAQIGVGIGKMYQFSNNYHIYRPIYEKLHPLDRAPGFYSHGLKGIAPQIVEVPDAFDSDLINFFGDYWHGSRYANQFFHRIAVPLRQAYAFWRNKERDEAIQIIARMPICDWSLATLEWMNRKHGKTS